MKPLKIEENVFRIALGLIFGIFHFQFVIEFLYFYPLEGIPDNFGIVTYDAPLFFLWKMFKIQAPSWVYNLFFAVVGSIMYVSFGVILGSIVDGMIGKVAGWQTPKKGNTPEINKR
ncbi:MAG: hypothetical protein HY920_07475 [Elusimicrobia bacterium]|nr:hypothetical protein [Elusimicrobiota bacterium]